MLNKPVIICAVSFSYCALPVMFVSPISNVYEIDACVGTTIIPSVQEPKELQRVRTSTRP
jgi:hypothetical protein